MLLARAVLLTCCSPAPLTCRSLRTSPLLACAVGRPAVEAWLDGAIAAERRKRAALQKEAEAAKKAEALGRWATLVVSNLYRIGPRDEKVIVEDWDRGGRPTELRFPPSEGTPKEQADAAFKKARRLRRGSVVVQALAEESNARERRLDEWRGRLLADETSTPAVRDEILRAAKTMKLKVSALTHDAHSKGDGRASAQKEPLFASTTGGWPGRQFTSPQVLKQPRPFLAPRAASLPSLCVQPHSALTATLGVHRACQSW